MASVVDNSCPYHESNGTCQAGFHGFCDWRGADYENCTRYVKAIQSKPKKSPEMLCEYYDESQPNKSCRIADGDCMWKGDPKKCPRYKDEKWPPTKCPAMHVGRSFSYHGNSISRECKVGGVECNRKNAYIDCLIWINRETPLRGAQEEAVQSIAQEAPPFAETSSDLGDLMANPSAMETIRAGGKEALDILDHAVQIACTSMGEMEEKVEDGNVMIEKLQEQLTVRNKMITAMQLRLARFESTEDGSAVMGMEKEIEGLEDRIMSKDRRIDEIMADLARWRKLKK